MAFLTPLNPTETTVWGKMKSSSGRSVKQKWYCFLSEVLQNRHCLFFNPFKGLVTQASKLYKSCNTLEVVRKKIGSGRWQWVSGKVCLGLGFGGVDHGFVTGCHAPVPAAVTLLLLDAGVVSGLVARIAKVGQHVCPKALVLWGHQAGQVVARFNLQRQREKLRISHEAGNKTTGSSWCKLNYFLS